jgi:hypothetical protein
MEEREQILTATTQNDFLEYARKSCMKNGSYCAWRYGEWGLPSIQDTFWALRIYKKLFLKPPSSDRTRRWLESETPRILSEGDSENIYYAFFSFQMLSLLFPWKEDWLTPLSESLLVDSSALLETEARIRASCLWLSLEKNAGRPLPLIRNRIAHHLQKWLSEVQEDRISLDLPAWGMLVEGRLRAGLPANPIEPRILDRYRDPEGGYRLTPDSQVDTMECLWWGTRLDRRYFGREIPACKEVEGKVGSYQAKNGGYGPRPGAIPDLASTGMALDILLTIRAQPTQSKRIS